MTIVFGCVLWVGVVTPEMNPFEFGMPVTTRLPGDIDGTHGPWSSIYVVTCNGAPYQCRIVLILVSGKTPEQVAR